MNTTRKVLTSTAVVFVLTEASLLQAWGPHIHISTPHVSIPAPAKIVQQVRNDAVHVTNETAKVTVQAAKVTSQAAVIVVAPVPTEVVPAAAKGISTASAAVQSAGTDLTKSANQLANNVINKSDQAVIDSGKATVDAANAAAHNANVVAEGANDVKRDVVQGVNTAGSAVASGARAVGTAADTVGKGAAHITLDAAHVALLFAQVEKKATVADVHSALTSASNSVQEIGEGHLLTAAQDLSEAVTSAMAATTHTEVDTEQEKDDFREAADMQHSVLETYQQIYQGHYGTAVEAMGRSFSSAGALVSQVDPDSGAVLVQAGAAVEQQAPYAETTFQDVKHANLELAIRDQTDEYVDPLKDAVEDAKTAAADAKDGKYGEAAMEATTAVILSQGDSKDAAQAQKAILSAEAALDSAKAAATQGKNGNYGTSAEDAGDALAYAGNAIKPYDSDKGSALIDLGTQIHEAAAHGKEATETEKQVVYAVKNPNDATKQQ